MKLFIICIILYLEQCVTARQNGIQECDKFMKTNPEPKPCVFTRLNGSGRYRGELEARDGNVDLTSEVEMTTLDVVRKGTFMSKCMAIEHILSRNKLRNTSTSHLLTLTARTDPDVFIGFINVSKICYDNKRDLASCNAVFFPRPELLAVPPLARSPLKQAFWDESNDMILPMKNWIKGMSMAISNGNIDSMWLSGLLINNLEDIAIKGNNWQELGLILAPLPNLRTLDLTNNNITTIPEGFFNNTPGITTLILSDNNLSQFMCNIRTRPVVFSALNKLTELQLQNTTITECPKNLNIQSLKILNFARNSISQLQRHCFSNLPRLKNLDISYNQLSSIEPGTFDKLKSLEMLSLSHNRLSVSSEILVHHLKYLRVLDLSYNEFHLELILGRIYLHVLNLAHNKLSHIINMTISIKKIKMLDLSWNNISSLKINKVESMNVSYNNIESLSQTILQGIDTKNLKDLDLGGNIFNCCNNDTPHFQHWLQNRSFIVYNLNRRASLTCRLSDPSQQLLLSSVVYDELLCSQTSNLAVELGIPLAALTALLMTTGAILYWYRAEFHYTRHLFRMKERAKVTDEERFNHCKYDAFVCYSNKNFLWVLHELIPKVENGPEGYRLCLHDRDFTLGAAIDANIGAALEKSRKVIIVLSNDFISSRWCQWELQMANHKTFEQNRDYVILIELEHLDHRTLPSHLRFLMASRTYLEWPNDEHRVERAWNRLRDALGQSIVQRTGIPLDRNNTVLNS